MKKIKFIYNPMSGNGSIINKLDLIIKNCQEYGYSIVPFRISDINPLENSLDDIEFRYEYIIISGGDGTINRVVNLLKKKNVDLPISIIPSGTANDFAHIINMPTEISKCIKKILRSDVKSVDVGKINDKYFVNIASAGMFTDVSQKIDPTFKQSLGRISYIIKGMEEVVNLTKYNIEVKSKECNYTGEMYLILILNGSTAGNMNFGTSSIIDDGLLDVIIFKSMPIKNAIAVLGNIIKGKPIDDLDGIIYFKTKEITIDCKEGIVTDIDGEKGPSFPVNIKCEHLNLKIKGLN